MSKPKPAIRDEPPKPPNVVAARAESVKVSSGPIPDPEMLARYERVHPGLSKIIVLSFEAEYQKRHRLESTALDADIEAMRLTNGNVARGQWLGFIIAIVGLVAGGVLIAFGHDVAGATLGAGGLASVLAAYFKSSLPKKDP